MEVSVSYVLIVVGWLGGAVNGAAVSTQEFTSAERCEAARLALVQDAKARGLEDALRPTSQSDRVVVLPNFPAVEPLGEGHVVEEPVVDSHDVDVLGGRTGAQPRQPDQDLPLLRPIGVRLEHRGRVVRDAVDREVEDQIVVVRLLQR